MAGVAARIRAGSAARRPFAPAAAGTRRAFSSARDHRARDAPETAFDHLEWDHQRLDALLADARARLERGEPATATFQAFRQGLEAHCRIEEELLFPAFERKPGSAATPARSR